MGFQSVERGIELSNEPCSFTELERILDYREEEVLEVVDDTTGHTAATAGAEGSAGSGSAANAEKGKSTDSNIQDEEEEEEEEDDAAAGGDADNEGSRGRGPAKQSRSEDLPPSASYELLQPIVRSRPGGRPSLSAQPAPIEGEDGAAATSGAAGEDGKEGNARSLVSIFNPVERCRRVLEKIWEDPYSQSFQEPVDTDTFTDYLDVVAEPMCLQDVKTKLLNGEYGRWGAHSKFAQDMRKIWRNCKLYNLYKSQIWHCAHALSIMFERLYQAWVVSYSDASLPLSNPLARPWELSCRRCMSEGNDDKMMLCDHCDAAHHIYCLTPKLKKVPDEAWICPRCIEWFGNTGAKVLSATAEDDARQLVEGALSRKVVKVRQKKYLVKWRGLSYRECTWETAKDINDDKLLAEYHRLNDSPPDEPPLTQAEIGLELAKDRKEQLYPAGMNGSRENPVTDLDAQIYAQIRAFHFLKWNKTVPDALLRECGPAAYAYMLGSREDMAVPVQVRDTIQNVAAQAKKLLLLEGTAQGGPGTGFESGDDTMDDGESETESMDLSTAEEMVRRAASEGDDESKSASASASAPTGAASAAVRKGKESGGSSREHWEEKVVTSGIAKGGKQVCWYRCSAAADPVFTAVADRLAEMVYSVARDHEKVPLSVYPSRPALPTRYQAPSEIEVCVCKGDEPLCVRVANFNGNLVILGFKPYDTRGGKGPVERSMRVRAGDMLIAIDGLYVHNFKFADILQLLQTNRPYLYLRFLRYPPCLDGRKADAVEFYMASKKPPKTSHRPFPTRSKFFGVYPAVHTPAADPDNGHSSAPSNGTTADVTAAEDAAGAMALRGVDRIAQAAAMADVVKPIGGAGSRAPTAASPATPIGGVNGVPSHGHGVRWVAEYFNGLHKVQVKGGALFDNEVAAALAYDEAVTVAEAATTAAGGRAGTTLPRQYKRNFKLATAASGATTSPVKSPGHQSSNGNDAGIDGSGDGVAATAACADEVTVDTPLGRRTLTAEAAALARRVEEERAVSAERVASFNKYCRLLRKKHAATTTAAAAESAAASSSVSRSKCNEAGNSGTAGKDDEDDRVGDDDAMDIDMSGAEESKEGTAKEIQPTVEKSDHSDKGDDNDDDDDDDEGVAEEDVPDFHSYDSRDSESDIGSMKMDDVIDYEEEEGTEDAGDDNDDDDNIDEKLVDNDDEEADEEGEEENAGSEDEADPDDNAWADSENEDWVPTSKKEQEFQPDGPIARLLRAVRESDYPPMRGEWTKYLLELCVTKPVITNASTGADGGGVGAGPEGGGSVRTRRIDQIDMASFEIVRTWDSVAMAARTMSGITAADIIAALTGKKDHAGGFRWQFSRLTAAEMSNITAEELAEEEAMEQVAVLSCLYFLCALLPAFCVIR